MAVKKYRILAAILILLCFSITVIYHLVKANFYTGGVFGYGAIAGFSGCLFLVSLILTIPPMARIGRLTKKHGLVFSMLISSVSVAATFIFTNLVTLIFGGMAQLQVFLAACFWCF
jgi:hypothetical protein